MTSTYRTAWDNAKLMIDGELQADNITTNSLSSSQSPHLIATNLGGNDLTLNFSTLFGSSVKAMDIGSISFDIGMEHSSRFDKLKLILESNSTEYAVMAYGSEGDLPQLNLPFTGDLYHVELSPTDFVYDSVSEYLLIKPNDLLSKFIFRTTDTSTDQSDVLFLSNFSITDRYGIPLYSESFAPYDQTGYTNFNLTNVSGMVTDHADRFWGLGSNPWTTSNWSKLTICVPSGSSLMDSGGAQFSINIHSHPFLSVSSLTSGLLRFSGFDDQGLSTEVVEVLIIGGVDKRVKWTDLLTNSDTTYLCQLETVGDFLFNQLVALPWQTGDYNPEPSYSSLDSLATHQSPALLSTEDFSVAGMTIFDTTIPTEDAVAIPKSGQYLDRRVTVTNDEAVAVVMSVRTLQGTGADGPMMGSDTDYLYLAWDGTNLLLKNESDSTLTSTQPSLDFSSRKMVRMEYHSGTTPTIRVLVDNEPVLTYSNASAALPTSVRAGFNKSTTALCAVDDYAFFRILSEQDVEWSNIAPILRYDSFDSGVSYGSAPKVLASGGTGTGVSGTLSLKNQVATTNNLEHLGYSNYSFAFKSPTTLSGDAYVKLFLGDRSNVYRLLLTSNNLMKLQSCTTSTCTSTATLLQGYYLNNRWYSGSIDLTDNEVSFTVVPYSDASSMADVVDVEFSEGYFDPETDLISSPSNYQSKVTTQVTNFFESVDVGNYHTTAIHLSNDSYVEVGEDDGTGTLEDLDYYNIWSPKGPLSLGQMFTLELTIIPDGNNTYGLVSKGDSFALRYDSTNDRFEYTIKDMDKHGLPLTSSITATTSTYQLTADVVHHISLVKDRTAFMFYANGQLLSSVSNTTFAVNNTGLGVVSPNN